MLTCSAGSRGVSFEIAKHIDEVDDFKCEDNARAKNHENSCGQDALPTSPAAKAGRGGAPSPHERFLYAP